MLVFTYTLNPLRLLDLSSLREATELRLTALVDVRLREAFGSYEGFFDEVYYVEVRYRNHCFAEEFDAAAMEAVDRESKGCDQLRLLSFFEGDLEVTARLRDQFHLVGMSARDTRRFRDKIAMKQLVSGCRLTVPKALELDWSRDTHALFAQCESELGLPFLVKPVALGGSLGVVRISSLEQFVECGRHRLDTAYMAEEEIVGEMLHLDSMVVDDRPTWFGCSRYNMAPLDFGRGKPVGSMPLLADDPQFRSLRDYAAAVARALRVHESLLHIEVIRQGDQLFFIEAAARASGGLVAMVYDRMFGYNMIQAQVTSQIGLEYRTESRDGSAYFWLFEPDGTSVREYLAERSIACETVPSAAGRRVARSLVGRHDTLLASHADYRYLSDAFTAVA